VSWRLSSSESPDGWNSHFFGSANASYVSPLVYGEVHNLTLTDHI
jgi:hypothetical protein